MGHHIRDGDDSVCDEIRKKWSKMLNFQSLQVGSLTYCCLYVYTACKQELELPASKKSFLLLFLTKAIKINTKKTKYIFIDKG